MATIEDINKTIESLRASTGVGSITPVVEANVLQLITDNLEQLKEVCQRELAKCAEKLNLVTLSFNTVADGSLFVTIRDGSGRSLGTLPIPTADNHEAGVMSPEMAEDLAQAKTKATQALQRVENIGKDYGHPEGLATLNEYGRLIQTEGLITEEKWAAEIYDQPDGGVAPLDEFGHVPVDRLPLNDIAAAIGGVGSSGPSIQLPKNLNERLIQVETSIENQHEDLTLAIFSIDQLKSDMAEADKSIRRDLKSYTKTLLNNLSFENDIAPSMISFMTACNGGQEVDLGHWGIFYNDQLNKNENYENAITELYTFHEEQANRNENYENVLKELTLFKEEYNETWDDALEEIRNDLIWGNETKAETIPQIINDIERLQNAVDRLTERLDAIAPEQPDEN